MIEEEDIQHGFPEQSSFPNEPKTVKMTWLWIGMLVSIPSLLLVGGGNQMVRLVWHYTLFYYFGIATVLWLFAKWKGQKDLRKVITNVGLKAFFESSVMFVLGHLLGFATLDFCLYFYFHFGHYYDKFK